MIDIVIADDHPIVREGLVKILKDNPDINIVGQSDNGEDAIKHCMIKRPDILILDITMPGPGFLEIINRSKAAVPNLRVLVLSIHPEEHYALRAIKGGAYGYLTKERSTGELTNAIRTIYEGNKYITATLAEKIVDGTAIRENNFKHEILSVREFEILCYLSEGMKVKDIASKLLLSPKTISTHRTRLFKKMGFNSTADLIRYTLENNIAERK